MSFMSPHQPHHSHRVGSCDKRCVTIDILPDDVLLLVFYFDGLGDIDPLYPFWQQLVHVCRRWRTIVFASPNFLNLRIVIDPCTSMELADIWPPLPIVIRNTIDWPTPRDYGFDVAIMHRNRVREIDLCLTSNWPLHLQRLALAMQEPFPALTHLELESAFYRHPAPALPEGFLGESAPHLQYLKLHCISFPALPNLLLSVTDLVNLTLSNIPDSGYFSPGAVVTGLAVLVKLKSLAIQFQTSRSPSDRHLPPPIRTVFSTLTYFEFRGATEYLEDLVARIDAPLLDTISITCLPVAHQFIFDLSEFGRFIGRTARFQEVNEAHIFIDSDYVEVKSPPPTRILEVRSEFRISCDFADWEISSLAQVLTSFFPSIYTAEHLYITLPDVFLSDWINAFGKMQWLEIFRPFTAVKSFYLYKEIAQCIAPALQELVGESVMNVLPALESIFLEKLDPGPVEDAIGQFVAERQLLGHPVAVSHWSRVGTPENLHSESPSSSPHALRLPYYCAQHE